MRSLGRQWSVISDQWSVVSGQLSVVSEGYLGGRGSCRAEFFWNRVAELVLGGPGGCQLSVKVLLGGLVITHETLRARGPLQRVLGLC